MLITLLLQLEQQYFIDPQKENSKNRMLFYGVMGAGVEILQGVSRKPSSSVLVCRRVETFQSRGD